VDDQGNLFITGRLKDVIIVAGKNHYPQDIEETVEQADPALRPHAVAAIALDGRHRESLIVLAEVQRRHVAGFDTAACAALLRSRAGYYWQAIRENEEAARALGIDTFRWKMIAVVLSAAMTAVAGVFFAFYYNNLFPEQIFNIGRSIEIILGPVIGGIGTLFGPILGAAVLSLLADGMTELVAALGWEIPGIKQVCYGLVLLIVVMFVPNGIWPALARKLGVSR